MQRTIMGVAGVSACTVHLDTGAVRVTGAGVDASSVIAAVTAEGYSCKVLESSLDFHVGGMTCSKCQGHVQRTIMGVAGVSACTVHLDTGAVRVTGAGVDASSVIAAVTAEGYSCCPLAPSADIDDDASNLRLLVIEVDSVSDSKSLVDASRALSQLPSVVSCIAVPSSSRIEIKGDSCLDGTTVTRELRRLGHQATIISFSPFSHLRIQIGPEVADATRVRIKTMISSFRGVSSVAIDDAGHLVVHGAVEPARIMLLLEDEGMSAQPAHENEHVLVNFDGEDCDDLSPFAQRLLTQSSTNEVATASSDRSTLTLVVQGMTCGACVAHVTSALSSVAGADNVSVNLITGSAHIRNWSGSSSDLIAALESKGYGAHVVSTKEPVDFTKQADAHFGQWLKIFYCAAFVAAIQSLFTPQSHLRMSMMSGDTMSAKAKSRLALINLLMHSWNSLFGQF